MADFSMNVDYGKPQNQMSLGDIVGLARGAQAYQQAEQLNPLALQKAQMEIEQAKKTNPLTVQKLTAEAGTAQTGEKKSQLELNQSQFNLAGNLLSGLESRATALAKSGDKETALKELKIAKEWMVSSGIPEKPNGPFKVAEDALNKGNFDGYLATLENMRNTLAGASSRYTSSLPDVVEVNNVKYNRDKKTGVLTPIVASANVGGGGGGKAGGGAGGGSKDQFLVNEDMPIRSIPGQVLQLDSRQQARYDEGSELAKQSTQALGQANEITQTVRKIRQNMGAASGSAPGQYLRKAGQWVAGNPELETLTKNLEDLYVRNAAAMGAPTDKARESIQTVTGSPNITREALSGIIDRVDASNESLKRYNKGFNEYSKNTSTENAYIHARNFQQAWQANSDPLVLMAQSIEASNKSPAEKEMMRQKMLKDLTDDELTALSRKKKNLEKLERGEIK
jgi:hypothetical protein